MKTIFNISRLLFLMTILLICLPKNEVDAQIRNGRFEYFEPDTMTNGDTLILTFSREINDLDFYDYTWQVNVDSLTGNTNATIYVQEHLGYTGTPTWVNTDTIAIPVAKRQFLTGTLTGVRQRLYIISSGTQSTKVTAWVRFRKKTF